MNYFFKKKLISYIYMMYNKFEQYFLEFMRYVDRLMDL